MKLSTLLTEQAQWPIGYFQVVNAFDITPGGGWTVKFGGSNNWVAKFTQNTKKISKGQADSMAASMPKETILSARDAVKMIGGLPPNTQVKITLI